MVDQCGHFMADTFTQYNQVRKTRLAHSLLASFTVSLAIVSNVRELCLELLCCGSNTSTQRVVCSRYVKQRSRKTMALKSHEKVSLCQRVEKQPISSCLPISQTKTRACLWNLLQRLFSVYNVSGDGKQDLLFAPTSGCPPSTLKRLILFVHFSTESKILSWPHVLIPGFLEGKF